MSTTTRVAAAVAAGYMLGRTKKLRLAITVGSMLAGSRLAGEVKPAALLQTLAGNPEVQRLQDQLRGQVMQAAKSAAMNVTTSRLEALNSSLKNRGTQDDEADEEDDEPTDEATESEQSQQPDAEDSGDDRGSRPQRGPAKRAPRGTKKAAASADSATRGVAKKAPAKKTASKQAASKGAAAKRTARKAAPGRPAAKRSAADAAGR